MSSSPIDKAIEDIIGVLRRQRSDMAYAFSSRTAIIIKAELLENLERAFAELKSDE